MRWYFTPLGQKIQILPYCVSILLAVLRLNGIHSIYLLALPALAIILG